MAGGRRTPARVARQGRGAPGPDVESDEPCLRVQAERFVLPAGAQLQLLHRLPAVLPGRRRLLLAHGDRHLPDCAQQARPVSQSARAAPPAFVNCINGAARSSRRLVGALSPEEIDIRCTFWMSPFSVPMMMLCGNSPVLTQLLSSLRADTRSYHFGAQLTAFMIVACVALAALTACRYSSTGSSRPSRSRTASSRRP